MFDRLFGTKSTLVDAAFRDFSTMLQQSAHMFDLALANLRGALLTNAILREANLKGADLTDAQLEGADLTRAEMGDGEASE